MFPPRTFVMPGSRRYNVVCTLLLAIAWCDAFQQVAVQRTARWQTIPKQLSSRHAPTQLQPAWLKPKNIHFHYSRSFVVEHLPSVVDSFRTEDSRSSVQDSVVTTPDVSIGARRCMPFTQVLKRTLSKISAWKTNLGWRSIRLRIATVALALMLAFGGSFSSAWAVTGGRMGGGSFKSSSSHSSGRNSGGSWRSSTQTNPGLYLRPRVQYGPSPPIVIFHQFSHGREWYAPTHGSAIVNTRVKTTDILILTGTGVLLAYGFRNNYRRNNGYGEGGPLGPGTTVASLTVALDVPNRGDPDNILAKLSRWSVTADTISRKGLQDLLSAVALELLRQERAITSAYAQCHHYSITGQAEREFQVLSVQSQSKVDRLTGTYIIPTLRPQ